MDGVSLAYGIEKLNDKNEFTNVSKLFPYRLRANYPNAGTYLPNAFQIFSSVGSPLYATVPNVDTEEEATAYTPTQQQYKEALINRGLTYWFLSNPRDINEIAQVAQNKHGVAICIFASQKEWSMEVPAVLDSSLTRENAYVRHCICVLPKSGHIINGVKYVTIQDSSPFGGIYLRHLSEDFIKSRAYPEKEYAGYWDTLKVLGTGEKPKYTFTKVLKVGSSSDEVKQMQKLLISEGLLADDCATGYFGGYTLAGVRAFQNKYADEILTPIGLTEPTNVWGSQCIAKANKLCK